MSLGDSKLKTQRREKGKKTNPLLGQGLSHKEKITRERISEERGIFLKRKNL